MRLTPASFALLTGTLGICCLTSLAKSDPASPPEPDGRWKAVSALLADDSGLWLAGARSGTITRVGSTNLQILPIGTSLSGLSPVSDGLLACTDAASRRILLIERKTGRVSRTITGRTGVCAPLADRAGQRLFVCNQFENTVSVYDLAAGKEEAVIPVLREPVALCLPGEGTELLVANLLPDGPANAPAVAASVSFITLTQGFPAVHLQLPDGSGALRGLACSTDGRYSVVAHNLARHRIPTVQVENAWMNAAAVSILDIPARRLVATVLLDEPKKGAANPWGILWTCGQERIVVAHAGTHELSVIDARALLAKLQSLPQGSLVGDLTLLRGIRTRISLSGKGPRALALAPDGKAVWVAEYFSDSLAQIDLPSESVVRRVELSPSRAPSPAERGEQLFHDAAISHQGWQSCSSCHPDGRADGFNWDLLNDGLGNAKNTKSLVGSHQTPPAMWTGVRQSAETAVRSGLRHILFALRPEADAIAIDEYLKSLKPVPSPHLVGGTNLSAQAQRGEKIFNAAGCAVCHPPGLFTDKLSHDVGTAKPGSRESVKLDTPGLAELWRTAPYLHDGSAATVREVVTTRNREDRHGKTSHLSAEDIDALVEYLLSL